MSVDRMIDDAFGLWGSWYRTNPEWRWNLMDFIIVFASLLENAIELSSLVSNDGEGIALTGMSGAQTGLNKRAATVLGGRWGNHFPVFFG